MEQMHTHTKRLQTLPPDDLELDDLIAGLQSEYGVPPTPQEYRLVIKTPSAEAEPSVDPEHSGPEAGDASADAPISTSGRRRRRRRSGPSSVAAESEPQDE